MGNGTAMQHKYCSMQKEIDMKKLAKYILFVLSILPCSLICAQGIWLNVAGFLYMGAWMWIAYALMRDYIDEEDIADTKID